jgi:hypothetical protein
MIPNNQQFSVILNVKESAFDVMFKSLCFLSFMNDFMISPIKYSMFLTNLEVLYLRKIDIKEKNPLLYRSSNNLVHGLIFFSFESSDFSFSGLRYYGPSGSLVYWIILRNFVLHQIHHFYPIITFEVLNLLFVFE